MGSIGRKKTKKHFASWRFKVLGPYSIYDVNTNPFSIRPDDVINLICKLLLIDIAGHTE
jgi:hypothetical protein